MTFTSFYRQKDGKLYLGENYRPNSPVRNDGVFYFTFIKKCMAPNNNFRYSFSNRIGNIFVAPLGESDFKLEWNREDESELYYKKEFPSNVVLTAEAFNNLFTLEKTVYRCEFTAVTVERYCGGDWGPWFTGRISLNAGSWDLDRCKLEIKFDEINPDQCFKDNKTTKINLFEKVDPNFLRTVNIYPEGITIEKVGYSIRTTGSTPCQWVPYWNGTGTPAAGGWKDYYNEYTQQYFTNPPNPDQYICTRLTNWARYVVTIPSTEPSPGPDWVFVSSTGGNTKYAKPVVTVDCEETRSTNGTVYTGLKIECKILSLASRIDNGVHLKEALEAFTDEFCDTLAVVSDFFQINPTTTTNINYVTNEVSKVDQLIIFQKSDVKRPSVSGNATKLEMSFEDILTILCLMFNARWRIEGTTLRIEHVSFFAKSAGFDLTQPQYKKWVKGLRRYSYENEEIPSREDFKFMEASAGDFAGVPIVYNGACVTKENRDNVKTIAVDKVTTDVELCLNNPEAKSNIVSDNGFVIIAARVAGTSLKILNEDPILSDRTKLNNTLGWAQLHRDYYRHDRPLRVGIMNNEETEFVSAKPTKKGAKITIPLCCDDIFNPDDTVKTPLGVGIVQKAEFSFRDQTLGLELLYEAEPIIINTAPTATIRTVLYKSGARDPRYIIPRMADAEFNISGLIIVAAPTLGTVEIRGLTFYYTPNDSLITPPANDIITFKAVDTGGAESNLGLISISYQA